MNKTIKIKVSNPGVEGDKRNFGKRGFHKVFCDDCGETFYTFISYPIGKPLLCNKCKKEKIKKIFG